MPKEIIKINWRGALLLFLFSLILLSLFISIILQFLYNRILHMLYLLCLGAGFMLGIMRHKIMDFVKKFAKDKFPKWFSEE